eukprot:TRINITY_DN74223_c0_g1_i1.p1 TRINITY_DN74223_c0_g1~~TRINITY_DN74223_c0_g1_i1.p1  ORF type:complete len:410 (-),score=42.06 TRINITY_DN74223_c0_g1_i1:61-1212(-)
MSAAACELRAHEADATAVSNEPLVSATSESESEGAPPSRLATWRQLGSRAARTALLLAVGGTVGLSGSMLTKQHRLRPPSVPVTKAIELQGTVLRDDGIYPPGYKILSNHVCGAARCAQGDLCCPGIYGFGNACGGSNAVCCAGRVGSIVCAAGGVCCRNSDRAAYCCAAGNLCSAEVCVAGPDQCFPGDAKVQVRGRGLVDVRTVALGEAVLTSIAAGQVQYEPVLDFLHKMDSSPGGEDYMAMEHSAGSVRASRSHLVFVVDARAGGLRGSKQASDVEVGDCLAVADDDGNGLCRLVLSVEATHGSSGMFAPLTASGTIVVDGVAASSFAIRNNLRVSHGSLQAAMFMVRLWKSVFGRFTDTGSVYTRFQHFYGAAFAVAK